MQQQNISAVESPYRVLIDRFDDVPSRVEISVWEKMTRVDRLMILRAAGCPEAAARFSFDQLRPCHRAAVRAASESLLAFIGGLCNG